MGDKQTRKRQLGTPANIISSAFNLPVMVIAGLIIGFFLSESFSSPIRELVIIVTTIVFFVIAMIELYLIGRHQAQKDSLSTLNQDHDLRKLILEDQENTE